MNDVFGLEIQEAFHYFLAPPGNQNNSEIMREIKCITALLSTAWLLVACNQQNPYIDTASKEIDHQTLITLTDKAFQADVLESEQIVLVDFWATWCGPCRAMAPIVASVAKKYEGRIKVGKLDVDKHPETAKTYEVSGIPYFALFKNGKAVETHTGMTSEDALVAWIEKHVD
jgi:thioredoxin 1